MTSLDFQNSPFDYRNVKCYRPEGCCPISPDKISLDEFLCAVRALLPPGTVFNHTLPARDPVQTITGVGAGCARVGCEQVVFGSCCETDPDCTSNPQYAQVNVVDVFAATAYSVMQQIYATYLESDPCTATLTIDKWLDRYGFPSGPCAPQWSTETKKLVLCLLQQLQGGYVLNKQTLDSVAAYFGVCITLRTPGDFNCGDNSMINGWTLGRDYPRAERCLSVNSCDPDSPPLPPSPARLVFTGRCDVSRVAIDIITCKCPTVVPANCLLPGSGGPVEPSDELYEAFHWLLQQMLPRGPDICVLRCEDFDECPEPEA